MIIPTPTVILALAFSEVVVPVLLGEADPVEVTVPDGNVSVVVIPDAVSLVVLAAKVCVVVITLLVPSMLLVESVVRCSSSPRHRCQYGCQRRQIVLKYSARKIEALCIYMVYL